MSTFSTQRQKSTIRENSAAPKAKSDSHHSTSTASECPVLLRLPDVSRVSLEEHFRRTAPLELKSALESLGTDPASQTTGMNDAEHSSTVQASGLNPNEEAFASLLAASPAFHGTGQAANISAANVNPPVNQPVIPAPLESQAVSVVSPPEAKADADDSHPPAEDPVAANKYLRRDKPTALPVRRSFRVYRPSWMPEVPPTLLLGVLICSTAVLIGMLWRSNKAEYQEVAVPAAQEDSQQTPNEAKSTATPRVAEVPPLPAVQNQKKDQPLKTAQQKPKSENPEELAESSAAKQTDSTSELAKQDSLEVTTNREAYADVHALPPVETAPSDNFYGQMLGGPPPHIVNNPHVNNPHAGNPIQGGTTTPGQAPIYEARRPAAEFRGMITKPDAADNHERY